MSEPLTTEIFEKHGRWFYEDHFMIRTPGPIPVRTEDGKTFEVITITLTSAWTTRGWNLSEVELRGTVMNDDGTYGDEVSREYDQPLAPDGGEQRAPDWLIRLAERRVARIPAPPTSAEEGK